MSWTKAFRSVGLTVNGDKTTINERTCPLGQRDPGLTVIEWPENQIWDEKSLGVALNGWEALEQARIEERSLVIPPLCMVLEYLRTHRRWLYLWPKLLACNCPAANPRGGNVDIVSFSFLSSDMTSGTVDLLWIDQDFWFPPHVFLFARQR